MSRPVIPIHHVRLSNSTMDLIQTCERKFQLEKLLYNDGEREHTEHTVFGSAYGIGVASYFIHQDEDQALYEAWMAYYPELETEKKSMVKCFNALMVTFRKIDELLMEYEVVSFKGKPAAELSFCLFTGKDYYFVGYMDLVLRHMFTGVYVVLDAKTTGLEIHNLDPLYKNSAQLIGYSIALDAIVGEAQATYEVMYLVCQMGRGFAPNVQVLTYKKTVLDRLQWFLTLGMDIERLERMKELNIYPRRGQSCMNYNRPCYYFGTCNLHSQDLPREEKEDETEYDFYFDMQTLIDDHVTRVYKK
jgi:hypothetical protein